MNVFITGDSHVAALKNGLTELISKKEAPEKIAVTIRPFGNGRFMRTPFFADKGTFVEIVNEHYLKRVQRLPLVGRETDWYGLSAPLHTARLLRMNNWLNFSPTCEKGKAPVSKSLQQRLVQDDQRYVLQMIEALKRIGVQIFVMEPPRVFRHHPLVEMAGPEIASCLDGFYRDLMKKRLASLEVPVVEVPDDSYDAEGFTLDELRSSNPEDKHHGNTTFGTLMMKRIFETMERQ